MKRIPLKEIVPLSKVAFQNWLNDRAPRMGAALAYYIALSLAPTVLILLAIAGLAFGAQAAEGRLVSQIQGFVGYEGAKAIQTMIEGARQLQRHCRYRAWAGHCVFRVFGGGQRTEGCDEHHLEGSRRHDFQHGPEHFQSGERPASFLRSRAGFRLVPGGIADCECLDICGGQVPELGRGAATGACSRPPIGWCPLL